MTVQPTVVVNLNDRMPYDVYIGRAGRGLDGYFGNPYKRNGIHSRDTLIARYAVYFAKRIVSDAEFKRRVLELRGKRLGCFCTPHPCHGNVIAAYLNELPP